MKERERKKSIFISSFSSLLFFSLQLLPLVGQFTPNVHVALGVIYAEMHEKEKAVDIY
jgi:hypothetical protein